MKEIAAPKAHLRVFCQSLAMMRMTRRAVVIPYVHDVMASMTKKTKGFTPYCFKVFQTMKVAPKV